MLALVKPQYITNEDGEKVSVIIPLSEYERIVQELEDIEDVQLFDEAKKSSEPPMPFDEYVKQRRAK
jgi:PHD/YefM family antitoxin component YafN of YafNO toxin-antitoxin module